MALATGHFQSSEPTSFPTLLGAHGPSNEDIQRTIANMFAEFVSNINVDGSVLDYLYQNGIITLYRKDKILSAPTSQSRTRRLLDKLLRSRNKVAFIVLREALKRDYHWFVKTIDTEIAAQAHQQAMMNEHRALIDKLQQNNRKLEDKLLLYKDWLHDNWKQTENSLMIENAWLKEKLRLKEAKLEKASEHMTELLHQHQEEQLALQGMRKQIAQLFEENRQLEKSKQPAATIKEPQQPKQQLDEQISTQRPLDSGGIEITDNNHSDDSIGELRDTAAATDNPTLQGEICVAENVPIDGIAYLDGFIYAVRRHGAGLIRVFNDRPPYSCLPDITVSGMTSPRDLAACSDYHCLYVSDCNSCVWKVKLENYNGQRDDTSGFGERWLTGIGWPARLSVTGGRLLVVTNGGLDVFGPFGPSGQYQQPMWHVKLPVGMISPRHAVEIPRSSSSGTPHSPFEAHYCTGSAGGAMSGATFMVCHGGGGSDWPQNYVSEVTCDRRMMQSYGCEIEDRSHELGAPVCVAAAASGSILVADWGVVDAAPSIQADVDEPDAMMTSSSASSSLVKQHRYHGTGRLMVFDSELRLTRTFPVTSAERNPNRDVDMLSATTESTRRPTRLCYVPQKNMLLIGTECGRLIMRKYPD